MVNTKKNQKLRRLCLVQDESSHWYAIPVDLKDEFERWAREMDQTEEGWDDLNEKYLEYQLNYHISAYSFVDLKDPEDGLEV